MNDLFLHFGMNVEYVVGVGETANDQSDVKFRVERLSCEENPEKCW